MGPVLEKWTVGRLKCRTQNRDQEPEAMQQDGGAGQRGAEEDASQEALAPLEQSIAQQCATLKKRKAFLCKYVLSGKRDMQPYKDGGRARRQ